MGCVAEKEGVQTINNPFEEKAKENLKTSKNSHALTIISGHQLSVFLLISNFRFRCQSFINFLILIIYCNSQ